MVRCRKEFAPRIQQRAAGDFFFTGPLHPLLFDSEDAEIAGAIRADLEASGKPIGAYDLLIAGQAMRNKLTLVTANSSEFARIKGLTWTDWGKTDL